MKIVAATSALLALTALLAAPAQGQELEEGLWTGALTPPGGGTEPVPVTFIVTSEGDGALAIVMTNPDLGPMELADEALAGDELTFWWNAGIRVDCALQRQDDGGFEGTCADERGAAGGGEGAVTMTPPAP